MMPLFAVGLDPANSLFHQVITVEVNLHGCLLTSRHRFGPSTRVRLETIPRDRTTAGYVVHSTPMEGTANEWLVGVALEVPGNFWGISVPPDDWSIRPF